MADDLLDFKKMSFLDHLDELRRRLIGCIIAVGIAFVICWTFSEQIYAFLQRPIQPYLDLYGSGRLSFTALTDPFMLYMRVAFLAALFLASPYILLQLWLFIAPGLYPSEKRYALPFVLFTTISFLGGALFAYQVAFPMLAGFLLAFGRQFNNIVTTDNYLSFLNRTLLGMGLVFETPVMIFFLSRLGLVTPRFLMKKFKYALLVIFAAAAVITPSGDVVNLCVWALPMIALYLIGVLVATLFPGRRAARSADGETDGNG
ncbi:MAG TPA: twin-arginine translocase subunit TatC [Acidobacteriota bacterium]